VCGWCKKNGHHESECRSKQAGKPQVQAIPIHATSGVEECSDTVTIAHTYHSRIECYDEDSNIEVPAVSCTALVSTGATHHMFKALPPAVLDQAFQAQDKGASACIMTAGGERLDNARVGSFSIYTENGNKLDLGQVLYHPKLSRNLLSGSKLLELPQVDEIRVMDDVMHIIDPQGRTIMQGVQTQDSLYEVKLFTSPSKQQQASAFVATNDDVMLVHERLGHISGSMLQRLNQSRTQAGMEPIATGKIPRTLDCDSCKQGKMILRSCSKAASEGHAATFPL